MNLDNINLNLGSTEITLRKTELETKSVLTPKKLSAVYDEGQKMVFMFDCSGSMNERVAKSYENQYSWTPELLADIRAKATGVILKMNYKLTALDPFDPALDLTDDEEEIFKMADADRGGEIVFSPKDDEDLKQRVIRNDLFSIFGVKPDFTKSHAVPPRRMDLVKKLAKSELNNRFKKHPKSHVSVIPFGSFPALLFDEGTPDMLWPALEKLAVDMEINNPETGQHEVTGGGTDILAAIRRAMEVCRAKPSPVGIHHFIMVSDGESATNALPEWVPAMKASGIVLDYIHIGDSHLNTDLVAVCKALGGEYVTVNSERDFESRFIEAVNRPLMITAGN